MAPLEIECFLALNDEDPDALGLLKSHTEPLIAMAHAEVPNLPTGQIFHKPFYAIYPEVKALLIQGRYGNVLSISTDTATATLTSLFSQTSVPHSLGLKSFTLSNLCRYGFPLRERSSTTD